MTFLVPLIVCRTLQGNDHILATSGRSARLSQGFQPRGGQEAVCARTCSKDTVGALKIRAGCSRLLWYNYKRTIR